VSPTLGLAWSAKRPTQPRASRLPKGSAPCGGHAASKRHAYADTAAKAPAQTTLAAYASDTAYKQTPPGAAAILRRSRGCRHRLARAADPAAQGHRLKHPL